MSTTTSEEPNTTTTTTDETKYIKATIYIKDGDASTIIERLNKGIENAEDHYTDFKPSSLVLHQTKSGHLIDALMLCLPDTYFCPVAMMAKCSGLRVTDVAKKVEEGRAKRAEEAENAKNKEVVSE